MTLGKLEQVELRTVWQREADKFTPWLAQPENLEILSKTLGMELQLTETERKVGLFRGDILCKDTRSEANVIIENQLEKTDHTHLGQILTYAAGLDCKTVIWIASQFTEEHRAALDFLNEITKEEISFFGVELELWKIGNSDPAPKFNIVCRPNNWEKYIQKMAQQSGDSTPGVKQQFAYWAAFKEFMDSRKGKVKCPNALPQNWLYLAIGKTGFQLMARVNTNENIITVGLRIYFSSADPIYTKEIFAKFFSQQEAIEAEFGGDLEWYEFPDNKESAVRVTKENADIRNDQDWPNQFEWLATNLEKLDQVFRPRIKDIVLEYKRSPE